MDRFFSLFGKITFIVLIIGSVVFGAYYVGQKYTFFPTNQATIGVSPVPPSGIVQKEISPTAFEPSPFTSGGVLVFKTYSINVAQDWAAAVVSHTSTSDVVTISRGKYAINITQAAFGAGACIYPGDPTFDGPSETFSNFVEVDGTNATYRRGQVTSPTPTEAHFTLCQKQNDQFTDVTTFGRITYTTPANPDPDILLQMDAMIASMQKQ